MMLAGTRKNGMGLRLCDKFWRTSCKQAELVAPFLSTVATLHEYFVLSVDKRDLEQGVIFEIGLANQKRRWKVP